jgi:hypothetical protein
MNKNPEISEIQTRNEARGPLGAIGLNADDMKIRTVITCMDFLSVCERLDQLRKRSFINVSTVAEETGLSRKAFYDCPAYMAIVNWYKDAPVRKRDEEVEALKDRVRKLEACNASLEASLKERLPLKTQLANAQADLVNEKRAHSVTEKSLSAANAKIMTLESLVDELRSSMRVVSGPTIGAAATARPN